MNGLWKGALRIACDVSLALLMVIVALTHRLKFKVSRLATYRILCEGLERVEGIMDAIECFHQMANELTQETFTRGGQAEWFRGKWLCISCKRCL